MSKKKKKILNENAKYSKKNKELTEMKNKENNMTLYGKFMLMAVLSFLALSIEYSVAILENVIYKKEELVSIMQISGHYLLTAILWIIVFFGIRDFSLKKYDTDIFNYNKKPALQGLMFATLIVATKLLLYYKILGNFQIVLEYNNTLKVFQENEAILPFISKVIYLFVRNLIFLLIIFYAQEAFDRNTEINNKKRNLMRYIGGGFIFALTYGLINIINYNLGLPQIIFFIFIPITCGFMYKQLLNKNIYYTYIYLTFMFII